MIPDGISCRSPEGLLPATRNLKNKKQTVAGCTKARMPLKGVLKRVQLISDLPGLENYDEKNN